MTDTVNQEESNIELPKVDELTALKARADMMGIPYHSSIGVEKLRAKIEAKLNDQPDPDAIDKVALDKPVVGMTEGMKRKKAQEEALKLVRVNITCMNPAKREWEGEIFTVGNDLVGTVKKYVPFNTTDGWHVPAILLQMIRERECQIFVTERAKNGVNVRTGKQIKEFAVDVLEPLTPAELKELAQRQAMAAGTAQ